MTEDSVTKRIIKRPMQRTMVRGCLLFIVLLCLLLCVQSYLLFSNALYSSNESKMTEVIDYVEKNTDIDDLSDCIKSKRASDKYDRLQTFINEIVDEFHLQYLYIAIPDPARGEMISVVSSTNAKERAEGEKDDPLLMVSDAYDKEQLEYYKSAMFKDGITFFEEESDYGHFYTGCKPLITSSGERAALLCADISLGTLHSTVNKYVAISISVTVAIGLLFLLLVLFWLKRTVTGPVSELERGTTDFADQSRAGVDPRELHFDVPEIRTDNEIESLYISIKHMIDDIKQYVEDIITAQKRAKNAEKAAIGMTKFSYQDTLTHVKNKLSYELKLDELDQMIQEGKREFAVVMMDVNDQSAINEKYGEDRGDEYLAGTCKHFAVVYRHSPVFRVEEDKFVAILSDIDYDIREKLISRVTREFGEFAADLTREPWQRWSGAVGMAACEMDDTAVRDVIERAKDAMLADKQRIKG